MKRELPDTEEQSESKRPATNAAVELEGIPASGAVQTTTVPTLTTTAEEAALVAGGEAGGGGSSMMATPLLKHWVVLMAILEVSVVVMAVLKGGTIKPLY